MKNNWADGIPWCEFIWHGAWSDPEIKICGKLYNYWDFDELVYGELECFFDNVPDYSTGNWEQLLEKLTWKQKVQIYKAVKCSLTE